ncbi:LacI family DNA-binding transcriptional regulator [Rhizobium sp. BK060]|uniref:LacI family DNA-binding transcriptional regulator n=1 Tax=Rhizobium sp. BK060 TaxID=2587096 RepID=UPI00160830F3|nr:LacI family DNA-binding transcriptional regulator [Rhizobium sp. BK060]MBB3395989.1 LacI family transcriptional regulator [Rhizobium sp. BK060]
MNLKELSSLLGLSATTVSRALNGYPEVAAATRRKVLAAAAETGYQPSQNAQRLAAGRSNSIAVVWTYSRDASERNFEMVLFRALTEASGRCDLHLVSVPPGSDNGLTRVRRLHASGAIAAAFFINPVNFPAFVGDCSFPILVFGRHVGSTVGVCLADIDYRASALKAARFLLQLGHTRLGVISRGRETMHREILQGVMEARLSWSGTNGKSADVSVVEARDFGDLLANSVKARPSGILCSDHHYARTFLRDAETAGLVAGKDISVIAYDNGAPSADAEVPVITTLKLNLDSSARSLLEFLKERIAERAAVRQVPLLLRPDLILGETTAPLAPEPRVQAGVQR